MTDPTISPTPVNPPLFGTAPSPVMPPPVTPAPPFVAPPVAPVNPAAPGLFPVPPGTPSPISTVPGPFHTTADGSGPSQVFPSRPSVDGTLRQGDPSARNPDGTLARNPDGSVRDPNARNPDGSVRDPNARNPDGSVRDPNARNPDGSVRDPNARNPDGSVRDPAPSNDPFRVRSQVTPGGPSMFGGAPGAPTSFVPPGSSAAPGTLGPNGLVSPVAPKKVPTIASLAPAEGPTTGGTVVAITGTNLAGVFAVTFGPSPATFTVNSDTSIVATSPPGGEAADVVVTAPDGPSVAGSKFTYTGTPVVVAKLNRDPPVGNDGALITKGGVILVMAPADYRRTVFGNLAVTLPADVPVNDVIEIHAIAARDHEGILVSVFPPIGESIGNHPVSTGFNADAASSVASNSGRSFRKVSATNWQSVGGGN